MMRSAVPFLLLALPAIVAAQPTAFEVISIKPNAANDNRVMIRMAPGGRFTATGIPVRVLISQAFNVRDFQIQGGPGWMSSDRFDVNAKAPDSVGERVPPEVLRPMLQNLLEERFQLKTHKESKELPTYSLVQGKGGPKLKVSDTPPPTPPAAAGVAAPGGGRPQMMRIGRGQIHANGVTMKSFAQQLSQILGRPVTDNTGIEGYYDIELDYAPEPGQGGGMMIGGGGPGAPPPPGAIPQADSNGPSIFTALQEKLGLKLESSKGPVDILVIDSISKPTEN
ncbi:hypothetical protein F183_A42110 [Bryobacterales bacterium F-183]|nr:hypothetical protein F183_A42110 [Bryobacterales bacterium F-183]